MRRSQMNVCHGKLGCPVLAWLEVLPPPERHTDYRFGWVSLVRWLALRHRGAWVDSMKLHPPQKVGLPCYLACL